MARLIATCSRGWERFFANVNDDHQAPRFVPSVPERVFAVFKGSQLQTSAAPTRVFCEWGVPARQRVWPPCSGTRPTGRDDASWCTRESDRAAPGDSGDDALHQALPAGYEAYAGVDGVAWVVPESVRAHTDTAEARGPLRYAGMAIAIADIGLFFAYPWPEERELMQKLFEAVASGRSHAGSVSHGHGYPRLSESVERDSCRTRVCM